MMTDNEIKKGLEELRKNQEDGYITALEFGGKRDMEHEKYLDLMGSTIDLIDRQKEKYDHLLKVARKMHTWIFLNTGDEQAAYDEIGLSDEDNMLLGYMGEITLVEKE